MKVTKNKKTDTENEKTECIPDLFKLRLSMINGAACDLRRRYEGGPAQRRVHPVVLYEGLARALPGGHVMEILVYPHQCKEMQMIVFTILLGPKHNECLDVHEPVPLRYSMEMLWKH